jgi:hypothetical protein
VRIHPTVSELIRPWSARRDRNDPAVSNETRGSRGNGIARLRRRRPRRFAYRACCRSQSTATNSLASSHAGRA